MWLKLAPFWAGPAAIIFFYYSYYTWKNARPLPAKFYFFMGCACLGVIAYYYYADPMFQDLRRHFGL